MQFEPAGIRQHALSAMVERSHHQLLDGEIRLRRLYRHSAQAGLGQRPRQRQRGRSVRLADRQRSDKFADQQRRLPYLGDGDEVLRRERHRLSAAVEARARIDAAQLEAERKTAYALLAAAKGSSERRLARLPVGQRLLGLRQGEEPEAAPGERDQHEDCKRQGDDPGPAPPACVGGHMILLRHAFSFRTCREASGLLGEPCGGPVSTVRREESRDKRRKLRLDLAVPPSAGPRCPE